MPARLSFALSFTPALSCSPPDAVTLSPPTSRPAAVARCDRLSLFHVISPARRSHVSRDLSSIPVFERVTATTGNSTCPACPPLSAGRLSRSALACWVSSVIDSDIIIPGFPPAETDMFSFAACPTVRSLLPPYAYKSFLLMLPESAVSYL